MSRVNANVPKYDGETFMRGLYQWRITRCTSISDGEAMMIDLECINVRKGSVGYDDPDSVLGRQVSGVWICLNPGNYPAHAARFERTAQNLFAAADLDPQDFDTDEFVGKEVWAYARRGKDAYGVPTDGLDTFGKCFVPADQVPADA